MNRRYIVLALALAIAGFFGCRYYVAHTVAPAENITAFVEQSAFKDLKPLFAQLVEIPGFTDQELEARFKENSELLKKHGFENLTTAKNYIIPVVLEGKKVLVKLPAADTRVNNYIVGLGKEALLDQNQLTDNDLNEFYAQFKKEDPALYQGVSRYSTANVLRKALQDGSIDSQVIEVPDVILLPYQEASSKEINDSHYFVVAQYIPFTILKNEDYKNLSLAQIKELIKAGWIGLLWNYNNNVGMTKANKLVLFDLEQPDRFKPQDFFRKNVARDQIFAINGIQSLLKVLKERADYAEILAYVEQLMSEQHLNAYNKQYLQDRLKEIE